MPPSIFYAPNVRKIKRKPWAKRNPNRTLRSPKESPIYT